MKRALVVASVLAVSCGDDGGGSAEDSEGSSSTTAAITSDSSTSTSDPSTTTDATSDGPDVQAPQFLDVRVAIDGGSVLDLNDNDATRVLPDPLDAEFTVRVEDDVTESDALSVDIIDADTSQPVEMATASFTNGLWSLTTRVEAGRSYRIRATDEASNSADSQFGLIVPTFAEAVVGSWEVFRYDTQTVAEVLRLTMVDDGTWSESAQIGTLMRSGTWSVDQDRLTLVETRNSDGDTDSNTEDGARSGVFYVDDTYLVPHPFLAAENQVGSIEGAWSRSWVEQDPGAGGLQDARTIEETITFSSNGDYQWEQTTTPVAGPASLASRSGTWSIELNGEYIGNFGDFLVLTTDVENGQPVDPPRETWQLHRARAGRLFVSPYVDEEA